MRTWLTKIQWCPGCGNYFIQLALKKAVEELHIPKHRLVIVTGIWCGSKMSQYVDGLGVETLHGRGIPFAIGVKLARPDLTVISLSGDGDSYGIGLSHLLHAARKNIPILHLTCDNQNYALTTGQASDTTPAGVTTKSTPWGNLYQPFSPLALVKSAGGTFVESVSGQDLGKLTATLVSALQFDGFSHINVQQACPSWKKW